MDYSNLIRLNKDNKYREEHFIIEKSLFFSLKSVKEMN